MSATEKVVAKRTRAPAKKKEKPADDAEKKPKRQRVDSAKSAPKKKTSKKINLLDMNLPESTFMTALYDDKQVNLEKARWLVVELRRHIKKK